MAPVLDRFRLDGKVAVVTGASSGLGVAFARALAEAGADVVVAARRAEQLERTAGLVQDAGRRALPVPTDVTDPQACEALAEAAVRELGRLDVLVNNAGAGSAVPALREPPESFRRIVELNLHACFAMAQAAARRMQPGSCILNVSSLAALVTVGLPNASYAASKAGLIGLTRDLAQQWTGRKGIRVNALAPGFFRTELTDSWFDSHFEAQLPLIPAGRAGEPDELAAAAVFLCSDAAAYVTGQVLSVDGGRSLL